MERLNLFFRLCTSALIALCILCCGRAGAVNIHALYTAACQREIGIILDVSNRQVKILNLDGHIATVERYGVIYFATYPLDVIPVGEVRNPNEVPLVEVKTWEDGGLATLVRGWPVDFSQDKISFLDLRGSEVVIDRTSIWKVNFDLEPGAVKFIKPPAQKYDFIHPYAFNSCPDSAAGRGVVKVYPQEVLSDSITIKREFDRLAAGHEQVRRYESAQQFYAIPEVYGNETSLGMWLEAGDRYGASQNRKNNFTPLLTNQFSSGPFGFQSEFRSGSGPLEHSFHEESQTQAYYRLKADYFHFTGMVDPNLLLVGSKYNWSKADLDLHDIRANESASLEFGFDYGHFAVEFGLGGAVNAGARVADLFHQETISISSVGLRYQNHSWLFDVFGGSTSQRGFDLGFTRANMQWSDHNRRFMLSLIQRSIAFSGIDTDAWGATGNMTASTFATKANSYTAAAWGYWRFKTRYWFGLMAGLESTALQFGSPDLSSSENHLYPKGGGMISLTF